jgi:hypothetical protein
MMHGQKTIKLQLIFLLCLFNFCSASTMFCTIRSIKETWCNSIWVFLNSKRMSSNSNILYSSQNDVWYKNHVKRCISQLVLTIKLEISDFFLQNITNWGNWTSILYTGLFKMIVGVLTTCHTQYTWDSSICIILFNRTTLQVFVTYLTGTLYVNPLRFYKHQHGNRVRSKLFVPCQRWWFQWRFWFVPSVSGYLREEEEHKPGPWRNPIERNHMELHLENEVARRVASDHHRFHARIILVNCAPSGEMRNYCTPHIIKENFENFLIHRCDYILISQVYFVWQVVRTRQSFWITLYYEGNMNFSLSNTKLFNMQEYEEVDVRLHI